MTALDVVEYTATVYLVFMLMLFAMEGVNSTETADWLQNLLLAAVFAGTFALVKFGI